MPQDNADAFRQHGKINLEQQRKRAKELLKRLQTGQAPDQEQRLYRAGHPVGPHRLADAQWLIARDLGFAGWPQLKAHIDAIDFAARHPGFAASLEADTVHWRCGNDIAHTLRLAGLSGEFRMFTDPLTMGPVPDVPLSELRHIRSRYISQVFGLDPVECRHRLDAEYNGLEHLDGTSRIVIWCEADAYDQLFLIRLLSGLRQRPARLELIEINQVPGVDRFIGIGQLAPELLAWLWPQRRALSEEALQLARRAWDAYRSPSPLAWAELARHPSPALPFLAPALLRQLQELPALRDGLSLTERLSLAFIGERGTVAFGRVFAELMAKREPLPYLGDDMYHALMRALIDGPAPLITESDPRLAWPERSLALTDLGRRVLAGESYWFDHAGLERWVGGVHLQGGRPHWAIDDDLRPVWRS